MPFAEKSNGNGQATRELKIWQGRSFKVAVLVGVLSIIATTILLGDRFLFTQSEGRELRYDLESHVDWGNEKYREVIARLDRIDQKQDLLLEQQTKIMIELGIHAQGGTK